MKYIRTVLNCRSSALDSKPFTGELKESVSWKEVKKSSVFVLLKKKKEDPGFLQNNQSLIDLKLNVFHLSPSSIHPSKAPENPDSFPNSADPKNPVQRWTVFEGLNCFSACVNRCEQMCSSPSATWTWRRNLKNVFLLFVLSLFESAKCAFVSGQN